MGVVMKVFILGLACMLQAHGQFRQIDPPASADSGMPLLTQGPDGSVYLAWTETSPQKDHALRFAKWNGSAWPPPETIAQGRNWFVNWADFGSLTALADGSMLAHWLPRAEGGGKFGYGIQIARRDPDRPVWRQVYGMSLDEKVDYAGFLTFAPGTRAAAYLAPPAQRERMAVSHENHDDEHGHRKTARFIEFRSDGSVLMDREIDADVCSCCQTALGKTRTGWIAAYRDHLPGEIRDISIVRFADGAWTQPRTLHPDGWKINGCPTDGPSLLANDANVAIAWLTRAGDVPKIQLALSNDEGRTFRPPVRIDAGAPLGRPNIAAFDTTSYLIAWLEKTASGNPEIRVRRVSRDGAVSPAMTVAQAPLGRASGFPKVVVAGDQVILAWRDERVRAVLLTKSQFIQSTTKDKK